ncbi:cyclic peptide export ABC transporter [Endothiovibrio diazotrophicus]
MRLIRLLTESGDAWLKRLLRATVMGAAADCLMAIMLVHAVDLALVGQVDERIPLAFLVLLGLILIARRKTFVDTAAWLAELTHRFRVEIIGALLRIELPEYERIGRSEVFGSLAVDTQVVAEAAEILANLLYMATLLLIFLSYLLWLSIPAGLIVLCVFAALSIAYLYNFERARRLEAAGEACESGYFEAVMGIVAGFKEIKLHRPKGERFFEQGFRRNADELRRSNTARGQAYAANFLLADSAILLSGTLIVFILPLIASVEASVEVRAIVILCLMPIATMMRDSPVVARANQAAGRLHQVREILTRAAAARPSEGEEATLTPPSLHRSIEFHGAVYHYTGSDGRTGFGVGPIDWRIEAGTITFIVGGNGSGKSTLMKMLTGLYPLDAGEILVDGEAIPQARRRLLFAIIFSDFHLFDRIYGVAEVDEARLNGFLQVLAIDHKVRYSDADGFSRLDLSTGQKKRVALAACMLEEVPVYVFDEWAADQDPEFRDYFYRELLPMLKRQGKTVIAVTHDDRYFDLCDQLVELDVGRLRRLKPSADPFISPAGSPSGDDPE